MITTQTRMLFIRHIDRKAWAKAEEEMFGDDPKKLRWAREGGGW